MNHPTNEQLAAFQANRLDTPGVVQVGAHVLHCPACRASLGMQWPATPAARTVEALFGAHLTYEQMEALVDGRTAEASRDADLHLRQCARCASEVADLRAFHRELAPRTLPALRWIAGAAAAAAAAVVLIILTRPDETATARVDPVQTPPRPAASARSVEPAPRRAATLTPDSSLLPVVEALRAGRVPSAGLLRELRPGAGQQRNAGSGTPELVLLGPAGSVTESTTPLFRWSGSGTRTVHVEVFDDEFRLVARSDAISGTEWRPAAPLPRGATLTWQLATAEPDREIFPPAPLPPARFSIVSEASFRLIRAARAQGRELDLALLYVQAGMLPEARKQFDQLVRAHPNDLELRRLAETLAHAE